MGHDDRHAADPRPGQAHARSRHPAGRPEGERRYPAGEGRQLADAARAVTNQPQAGPAQVELIVNTQIINGPDGKPAAIALQFGASMTAYMVQAHVEQV